MWSEQGGNKLEKLVKTMIYVYRTRKRRKGWKGGERKKTESSSGKE